MKNLFHSVLLFCFLSMSFGSEGDYSLWEQAISGSNPLHWYKFNETSGSVCNDHGSGGLDGSYAGVNLAQAGFFGSDGAVKFPGSGTNSVVLNGANIDAAWTVEYILQKKDKGAQALQDSGSYSVRVEQWNASGRIGLTQYGFADHTFSTIGSLSQIVPLDEWTHLVFRRDASGNTQAFINGIMVGTLGMAIPLPMNRIGSHNGSDDQFNGILDEAVIYDRPLTDDEIIGHSRRAISGYSLGDFDMDGSVDIDDLQTFCQLWLDDCGEPPWCMTVDVDYSSKVDIADFSVLSKDWHKGYIPPSATNVIPRPAHVQKTAGTFQLTSVMSILVEDGSDQLLEVANALADILNPATGFDLTVSTTIATVPPVNSILLTTAGSDASFGEEGYELISTPDTLLIRAPQAAGVFYGIQTLRQLLPYQIERDSVVSGVDWSFSCVSIQDQPRFTWRGMHLDESRHFYGIDYVKKYLDYMAMYKMNKFHWHIVDDQGWRIEILQYPRLTTVGASRSGCSGEDSPYVGYYTQQQVRDIVEYARRRYITVVPEIEMPGHTQASLEAYPEFSCTGGPFADVCPSWSGVQYDNVYSPSEETFAFLENVLIEVMDLFPSEYIHIGGDEVNKRAWQESALAQQVMANNGLANENELQTWFISRISDFLVANGRRAVGWSEIIHGGIPNNAVIMSWLGMGAGITAAQNGHDAIMSPTSHCYFDYSYGGISTEKVYSFDPMPYELTEAQAYHVLGAQGNVWTEHIATGKGVDEKAMPRMTALAEVVWTETERKVWEDFSNRLQRHYLRLDELDVNYYYNWKVEGGPELKEPAEVTSSYWAYSDYLHEYAYDDDMKSYFWGDRNISVGDTVTVTLDTSRQCSTVKVYMGTDGKPGDIMSDGVIEVSSDGINYSVVGDLSGMDTVVAFTPQMVKSARIRSKADQVTWLILREIVLE